MDRRTQDAVDNLILVMAPAVAAVRRSLAKGLPPLTRATLRAGGEAGVAILLKRLLTAETGLRSAKDTVKPVLGMRFDFSNPNVAKWAEEHAAESIDEITETTRKDIAAAVARAAEEGDLDQQYEDILDAVGDEDRATMISRTESMSSANAGLGASWDQAVEEGLLPENAKKEFIATESGACPICEEMDGEIVPIDEPFSSGDDQPPVHVNCRCTSAISL